MIVALFVIYIMLLFRSKYKIGKIENPVKIQGEVSGYEIKLGKRKRWVYDIVSFYVDNDMFIAKNTSSPFYLTGKSKIGKKYDVVYDKTNPNSNIIVDNTIFIQIKRSIVILISIYAIALIAFMFLC